MSVVTIQVPGVGEVNVIAAERYTGTLTGGGRNTETYEVTYRGHTMEGAWDGDARHNTIAGPAPAPLVPLLTALIVARRRERERRDLEGWWREDPLTCPDPREPAPTPDQVETLRAAGYTAKGVATRRLRLSDPSRSASTPSAS